MAGVNCVYMLPGHRKYIMFCLANFHLSCSSKPTEKPKELIIPLIQKNRWHRPERVGQTEEKGGKTQEVVQDADSVDSQAVKELIEGV